MYSLLINTQPICMKLYIFFEFISIIIIIVNFVTKFTTSYVKLLPTMFTILYLLLNTKYLTKNNYYLKLSIILAFCADFFFAIEVPVLGVEFFIVVQLCYLYYLFARKNLKETLPLIFGNLFLYLIFNNKILILESLLYALISLLNIKFAYRLTKEILSKKFLFSLIFLFICDFSIAIIESFKPTYIVYISLSIIEWICYIVYLINMTRYISNNSRYETYSNIL